MLFRPALGEEGVAEKVVLNMQPLTYAQVLYGCIAYVTSQQGRVREFCHQQCDQTEYTGNVRQKYQVTLQKS
jgi:hypothetical protein